MGGGFSTSSGGMGSAATNPGVLGSVLRGAGWDSGSSGEGGLALTGSAAWGRSVEVSLEFLIIEISGSVRGSGGATSKVTVSALGTRVTLGKRPKITDRETRPVRITTERRSALGSGPRVSSRAKRGTPLP
jgi:hypothetical protein